MPALNVSGDQPTHPSVLFWPSVAVLERVLYLM